MKLKLCLGSACFARGNNKVLRTLEEKIKSGEWADVELSVCLCQQLCESGPNAAVDGHDYGEMTPEKLEDLVMEASREKNGGGER